MRVFVLLLSFVPVVLWAQRDAHIRFNRLVDRAMALAVSEEYGSALASYDSALSIIPWETGVYFDAVVSAIAAGRPDKANTYLCAGVEHGFDPAVFTDPNWDLFLASEASAPFRNQKDHCRARFLARADTATIRRIRAMGERDQSVRDGSATMLHNDSLNFEELIAISEEQGFPSAMTIGPSMVWTLLWHHRGAEYPTSPQWRRILPFIHEAIDAGHLDPAFLCMFEDMNDRDNGHPMRYGALLGYYRSMPEEALLVDPQELQRNRASVGWGPIIDFAAVVGVDPKRIRYAAD